MERQNERSEYWRQVIKGILLIGMGVQILLGLVWIAGNFRGTGFGAETDSYVRAAKTLVMDEYTGPLYSLFLMITGKVTGLAGLSPAPVVFCVQLVLSYVCSGAFLCLCGFGGRLLDRRILLGGLYLMTSPLVIQWHMTLLPASLTGSLLLLQLGFLLKACRSRAYRDERLFLKTAGLWAALSLLSPDYVWLAGFGAAVCAVLVVARRGFRRTVRVAATAAVGLCLILAGSSVLQTPGSGGRIQRSVGAALVSRMVWPDFGTQYSFWPEEVREVISEEEAAAFSDSPDSVQWEFGPRLEAVWGREQSEKLYRRMAFSGLKVNTRRIAEDIARDAMAYMIPPFGVTAQLQGAGVSCTGWNYENMRANTPKLAAVLMDCGLTGFWVMLPVAVAAGIWQMVWQRKKRRQAESQSMESRCAGDRRAENRSMESRCAGDRQAENRKGTAAAVFLAIVWVGVQAFWYTMSGAGVMDYGNVTAVSALWYSVILAGYHQLAGELSPLQTDA